MYDDTITLFNRYKSNSGDLWYPTVIRGVDLIVDTASIIAQYGEKNENSARLHIKLNGGQIGGKPYLQPKEWKTLLNDTMVDYVTLQSSTDFFIKGEYDAGVVDDNDYKEGFFQYMKKHRDNVFTVTSVGEYKVIPHLEILAK